MIIKKNYFFYSKSKMMFFNFLNNFIKFTLAFLAEYVNIKSYQNKITIKKNYFFHSKLKIVFFNVLNSFIKFILAFSATKKIISLAEHVNIKFYHNKMIIKDNCFFRLTSETVFFNILNNFTGFIIAFLTTKKVINKTYLFSLMISLIVMFSTNYLFKLSLVLFMPLDVSNNFINTLFLNILIILTIFSRTGLITYIFFIIKMKFNLLRNRYFKERRELFFSSFIFLKDTFMPSETLNEFSDVFYNTNFFFVTIISDIYIAVSILLFLLTITIMLALKKKDKPHSSNVINSNKPLSLKYINKNFFINSNFISDVNVCLKVSCPFVLLLSFLLLYNTEDELCFYLAESSLYMSTIISFSIYFKLMVLSISFFYLIAITNNDSINFKNTTNEYILLILIAILGTMLLCSTHDLLTAYLAIELLSLSSYLLAAFIKDSHYSVDAGFKYFVIGSISSAFFLIGASFIYVVGGTLSFSDLSLLLFKSKEFQPFINTLNNPNFHQNILDKFYGYTSLDSALLDYESTEARVLLQHILWSDNMTTVDPVKELATKIIESRPELLFVSSLELEDYYTKAIELRYGSPSSKNSSFLKEKLESEKLYGKNWARNLAKDIFYDNPALPFLNSIANLNVVCDNILDKVFGVLNIEKAIKNFHSKDALLLMQKLEWYNELGFDWKKIVTKRILFFFESLFSNGNVSLNFFKSVLEKHYGVVDFEKALNNFKSYDAKLLLHNILWSHHYRTTWYEELWEELFFSNNNHFDLHPNNKIDVKGSLTELIRYGLPIFHYNLNIEEAINNFRSNDAGFLLQKILFHNDPQIESDIINTLVDEILDASSYKNPPAAPLLGEMNTQEFLDQCLGLFIEKGFDPKKTLDPESKSASLAAQRRFFNHLFGPDWQNRVVQSLLENNYLETLKGKDLKVTLFYKILFYKFYFENIDHIDEFAGLKDYNSREAAVLLQSLLWHKDHGVLWAKKFVESVLSNRFDNPLPTFTFKDLEDFYRTVYFCEVGFFVGPEVLMNYESKSASMLLQQLHWMHVCKTNDPISLIADNIIMQLDPSFPESPHISRDINPQKYDCDLLTSFNIGQEISEGSTKTKPSVCDEKFFIMSSFDCKKFHEEFLLKNFENKESTFFKDFRKSVIAYIDNSSSCNIKKKLYFNSFTDKVNVFFMDSTNYNNFDQDTFIKYFKSCLRHESEIKNFTKKALPILEQKAYYDCSRKHESIVIKKLTDGEPVSVDTLVNSILQCNKCEKEFIERELEITTEEFSRFFLKCLQENKETPEKLSLCINNIAVDKLKNKWDIKSEIFNSSEYKEVDQRTQFDFSKIASSSLLEKLETTKLYVYENKSIKENNDFFDAQEKYKKELNDSYDKATFRYCEYPNFLDYRINWNLESRKINNLFHQLLKTKYGYWKLKYGENWRSVLNESLTLNKQFPQLRLDPTITTSGIFSLYSEYIDGIYDREISLDNLLKKQSDIWKKHFGENWKQDVPMALLFSDSHPILCVNEKQLNDLLDRYIHFHYGLSKPINFSELNDPKVQSLLLNQLLWAHSFGEDWRKKVVLELLKLENSHKSLNLFENLISFYSTFLHTVSSEYLNIENALSNFRSKDASILLQLILWEKAYNHTLLHGVFDFSVKQSNISTLSPFSKENELLFARSIIDNYYDTFNLKDFFKNQRSQLLLLHKIHWAHTTGNDWEYHLSEAIIQNHKKLDPFEIPVSKMDTQFYHQNAFKRYYGPLDFSKPFHLWKKTDLQKMLHQILWYHNYRENAGMELMAELTRNDKFHFFDNTNTNLIACYDEFIDRFHMQKQVLREKPSPFFTRIYNSPPLPEGCFAKHGAGWRGILVFMELNKHPELGYLFNINLEHACKNFLIEYYGQEIVKEGLTNFKSKDASLMLLKILWWQEHESNWTHKIIYKILEENSEIKQLSNKSFISKYTNTDLKIMQYGMLFILFSIFIKLALAPFHLWSLDIYEGSPTNSAFFFAVITKFGLFSFLIQFCYIAFFYMSVNWQFYCGCFGLLSIIIGSLGGLTQYSLKTILAYSSISHMGYCALTLGSKSVYGIQVLIFYLLIYCLSGISLWYILLILKLKTQGTRKINKNLSDLSQFNKINKALAFSIACILFSLAGLPPFVGFTAKFSVFLTLLNEYLYFICSLAILFSVISTFYYLRIIKVMFFENVIIGKLYYPLTNNKIIALSYLVSLLIFFFLNPNLLFLSIYEVIFNFF